MIALKVVSINGRAPASPLSANFDETGGSVGRSTRSTLVLLDPRRRISRLHAAILFRGRKYAIKNMSAAAPIYLNERPLACGNQASIADGDEIRIGAYKMVVTESRREPLAALPGDRTLRRADEATGKKEPSFSSGFPDSQISGFTKKEDVADGTPNPDAVEATTKAQSIQRQKRASDLS